MSSFEERLLNQGELVLQELEYIRQNTRGSLTGEGQDAGWDIQEYGTLFSGNLPGRPDNTISPGDQVTIISEEDTKGQFAVATLVTDNPYLNVIIQLKSPTNTWNRSVSLNPFTLWQANVNFYNDRVPFYSRYDKANMVFGALWMPSLKLGFHHGVKLLVQNPTTNPETTLANTTATVIEVVVVRTLYSETQNIVGSVVSKLVPPIVMSALQKIHRLK